MISNISLFVKPDNFLDLSDFVLLVLMWKSTFGSCNNNKIENYFGNMLDKYTKRIYKTLEWIFGYIMTRKDG